MATCESVQEWDGFPETRKPSRLDQFWPTLPEALCEDCGAARMTCADSPLDSEVDRPYW